ncbi:MAG: DUF488 family protein [Candidatus Bipolaricaulota bacterium]|nr:DUF488 family protein [Candidatus Bipolaricaulota bacterium]MCX7844325.1 DUF488 family protein [Candidatus Bipolaricaulota bacterium]MDW8152509.1 DUF488 family protein [Candidatus Bipolaricaulota bacterium]
MPEIRVKRVYDPVEEGDGVRILVDRTWPRGLSKEKARIDLWLRELAPSPDLCRWYGHVPERWPEFLARYHAELAQKSAALAKLRELGRQGPITLLFASAERERNNALALKLFLEKEGR